MLKRIEKLPSSTGRELTVKDYIKGLGLVILLCLSETLPELKEIITGHDFGQYNEIVKIVFVMGAWFLQRWAKNNAK